VDKLNVIYIDKNHLPNNVDISVGSLNEGVEDWNEKDLRIVCIHQRV
jgi:hypothetical protein